jgi:hypothetical protein
MSFCFYYLEVNFGYLDWILLWREVEKKDYWTKKQKNWSVLVKMKLAVEIVQ